VKLTRKLTIMTSALLVAGLASAQTPAAQTTTTAAAQQTAAQPAQQQVVAKAKKAKKNKKGKKVEEKTTQATPAVDAAPTAKVEAASVQVERNVASKEVSASVKDASVTPAQTSTTTAAPAAAPTKKWGVSLVTELDLDNTNGEGVKNISEATINTINYVGASYKVTDNTKVGLRQYFTYDHNPKVNSSIDDVKKGFAAATVATKTAGILKSDEIAPMFWYYIPDATSEKNTYGADLKDFYGQLRMDAEIGWTLNPKWSVSYYINPRQTLGAKQSFEKADGTAGSFQATSRLIHYGFVYYTLNDNVQFYADVGMDHKMATESLTSTSDDALSAIGANFTFFGGKLIINPEISNTVHLKQAGQYVSGPRWMQSEDISYALVTAISL